MNRSITGAVFGVTLFLLAYCLCFWFGIMPKFYPLQEKVALADPVKGAISVKFVGSAVVGVVAGLVGFVVGRFLPGRAAGAIHLLAWAMMIAAGLYLIGRETNSYICHFLG